MHGRRVVDFDPLMRSDAPQRVINVRKMVKGHVTNKRAFDGGIAKPSMKPAEENTQLREQRKRNDQPIGIHACSPRVVSEQPAQAAAGAQARTAPASTGQNPYESAVTGSYPYPSPYPSQPYPSAATPSAANARPAAANPALDARDRRDARDDRDGRHYRPGQPSADGYGPASVDYGTPGSGTSRDRRH